MVAEAQWPAAATEPVDVVAVMVTWNSSRHLPGSVGALDAAFEGVRSWRLVVVDNDSADGSLDLAGRLAPEAVLVASGRNAGYAAGLNAGRRAGLPARAHLVLNPDVVLAPGSVARLLERLEQDGCGIAVPLQHDADGRRLPSLRRAPSISRALGEALAGGRVAGRYRWLGEMVTTDAPYRRDSDAEWASGSVMLISESCWSAVGDWDETFFLYSEETDFALRASDAGFTVGLASRAEAVHIGGEAHVSPRLYTLLTLNRLRLYARRHSSLATAAFATAVALGELLRVSGRTHRAALVALLRPRVRRRRLAWRP